MSYILLDYQCPAGHRQESLEPRESPAASKPCACGSEAQRALSAPKLRFPLSSVSRGKNEAPPPNVIDTRPLADGMPVSEWRAKQRAKRREEIWRATKDM